MDSCWQKVKQSLKNTLAEHSFRMWIEPMGFMGMDDNVITLSCPNSFFKRRIKDYYLSALTTGFLDCGISDPVIKITTEKKKGRPMGKTVSSRPASVAVKTGSVKKNKRKHLTPLTIASPAGRPMQLDLPGLNLQCGSGRMLKKGYTFDNFIVGRNSDFAYSATLSLAQGGNASGAIYLLSDTGLGKSHLSQAVGHHIMSRGATDRVYYVTAEDFTNEMVYSLKTNTIDGFKEKYRKKCDVLILEDIHFLSGKDATQKELAMTLDYLLDADKKIIFSGSYLPDDIPKMNDHLKSRLTLGLVTKIEPPDYSTRVKILKKKAQVGRCAVPTEVMEYLAQELTDNVRQLESGLAGVTARGNLLGEDININMARNVLVNIARNKKKITVDSIKDLVCREYSVSLEELVSPSRKKRVVAPRQAAMFLARKYTDQPLKKIGRSFNRYHATAIYSINAVEKKLKQKGIFSEQMKLLYKKIETGRL